MLLKHLSYYYLPTFVLIVVAEIRIVPVDVTRNLTITCPIKKNKDVMWVREGREDKQADRLAILENGSLFLMDVDKNDTGIYACYPANVVDDDLMKSRVKVYVRTPPPSLVNVTVRPSTILALLIWAVNGTGGYPISHFTAQYKLAFENEWKAISPTHISPNARQLEVFKLDPNSTYAFRIWATNVLGDGEPTELMTKTRFTVPQEELERHFLRDIDKFDPRVWIIAVAIVMGTLVLLGFGTCFLLYQECRTPGVTDEQEIIELVPNIILNPGFDGENSHTEYSEVPADENSNNETAVRLNNNTVVQPTRNNNNV